VAVRRAGQQYVIPRSKAMVMTVEEKQRFKIMEDQLQNINGKLDDIMSAIKGDAFGQNAGIIAEIKDLKSRVRKMEDLKQRLMWTALGAGLAAGFTVDKLWTFIQKLIV